MPARKLRIVEEYDYVEVPLQLIMILTLILNQLRN